MVEFSKNSISYEVNLIISWIGVIKAAPGLEFFKLQQEQQIMQVFVLHIFQLINEPTSIVMSRYGINMLLDSDEIIHEFIYWLIFEKTGKNMLCQIHYVCRENVIFMGIDSSLDSRKPKTNNLLLPQLIVIYNNFQSHLKFNKSNYWVHLLPSGVTCHVLP